MNMLILSPDNDQLAATFLDKRRTKKYRVKGEIDIEAFNGCYLPVQDIVHMETNFFQLYFLKNNSLVYKGSIIKTKQKDAVYFIDRKSQELYARHILYVAAKIFQTMSFESKDKILKLLISGA